MELIKLLNHLKLDNLQCQMIYYNLVRIARLTRQEHEEQGSEGEEKDEPD